jgi:anti-anti-sigma factor
MTEMPSKKNLEIPRLDSSEAIIKISGFFNQKNMEDLERAFSKIDQFRPQSLIIDCRDLHHLDTPNIALLVGKLNEFKSQGRSLILREVPSSVMKVLKISRLDNLFSIEFKSRKSEKEDDSPNVPTPLDLRSRLESVDHRQEFSEWTTEFLDSYENLYRAHIENELSGRFAEDFALALFSNSSHPLIVFDPVDGRILDGNPPAKELVGSSDFQQDTISVYDLCVDLRGEDKPWTVDRDHVKSDKAPLEQTWQFGENLRRELRVSYVRVEHPQPECVLALCQDITPEWNLEIENRNLQKQLKGTLRDLSFLEKQTRDFNRLLEREPLCFSILDGAMEVIPEAEAGIVFLFNSQLNRLVAQAAIGFPRPDRIATLSLKQGECLPGIQCDKFWNHLSIGSKEMLSNESRLLWEESIRPKAIRSSLVHPLVSQQAQVGYLVLVSFDDPRAFRKYDEELLDSLTLAGATALEKSFLVERIRYSEIHLRSILESVPISVFSVDDNAHVDTWNYESQRLFGWKAGDAIGKPYSRFLAGTDSDEARHLATSLEFLTPWTGEIEIKTRSGEVVPTRHIIQPFLNTEGIKQGMVVVVEDIRKMVELRDQMMKAQKLESVGILAGGIAHDFNNLIGAILGYASFLRSQLGEENKNTRYAEVIESTAEQASQLTRKLLDFASGSTEQKVLTDLRKLLEDCLELVKPSIPVGIRLSIALGTEPIYAYVSPTAIQQVVMNLCLNARDVLSEGGEIVVRLTKCEGIPKNLASGPPPEASGSWTLIEVADNGPGIDDSMRAEIFKPFFTTKSAGKGSGLGLAMVHRAVIEHGGWLELKTEIGQGSLFRIGLPESQISTNKGSAQSDIEAPQKRKTILVVDDEPLVRELAMTVLESAGYEVKSAEDGAEALTIFNSDPGSFSLALIDVLMPVMGGEELVREIEKIRPDFPILLSSGYSPKTSLDEKIKTGDLEFLPKPYRSRQLLEKVEQMLKENG